MYIAMNRFRIALGREEEFTDIWRNRDTHLKEVPGFQTFHLLQGESDEECTLFASHTVWESEQAFRDWVQSEAFKKAHANASSAKGVYLGPPKFEGFTRVI